MKGQTLIEAVLALGIVAIVLSGIAIAAASSLSNAGFGKNQALATQYAQEGIELLRNIRNSSYSTFATYSGNYCISKSATSMPLASPSCTTPNIDNTFIRAIQITQNPPSPDCGSNTTKATATVSWTDGKCSSGTYCHSSTIISCFSSVNPIPTP